MKRPKRYKRNKDLVKDAVRNSIKKSNEQTKYWNKKIEEALSKLV